MDQTTDQLHHTNVININLIDDIDEPPNPGMEIDEEEVKLNREIGCPRTKSITLPLI